MSSTLSKFVSDSFDDVQVTSYAWRLMRVGVMVAVVCTAAEAKFNSLNCITDTTFAAHLGMIENEVKYSRLMLKSPNFTKEDPTEGIETTWAHFMIRFDLWTVWLCFIGVEMISSTTKNWLALSFKNIQKFREIDDKEDIRKQLARFREIYTESIKGTHLDNNDKILSYIAIMDGTILICALAANFAHFVLVGYQFQFGFLPYELWFKSSLPAYDYGYFQCYNKGSVIIDLTIVAFSYMLPIFFVMAILETFRHCYAHSRAADSATEGDDGLAILIGHSCEESTVVLYRSCLSYKSAAIEVVPSDDDLQSFTY